MSFQVSETMKRLRDALIRRRRKVMDGAFLSDLEFGPVENQQFEVTAKWESSSEIVKKGSGQHTSTYTKDNALRIGRYSHVHGRYQMTFCGFADNLIKEILRARGVVR
jgi:hypothetical protein